MKGQASSTLLDENLTCEFKRKNSVTLAKSCMKTEQFLLTVKGSLFFTVELKNDTKAKRKLPAVFMRPSLQLFFELLKNSAPCSSLSSPRRNSSTQINPAQVALTKMLRNEAKIYQEKGFLSTDHEGHLLTSPGCFLTLTSSLDVVQVKFAFVMFLL